MNQSPVGNFFSSIGLTLDPQQHTVIEGETVQPITAGNCDNVISILGYYGLLAVSGPDAAKFLQGQTTCDVTSITEEQAGAGAYCTPKGRMISNFLLTKKAPDNYFLRMRDSVLNNTQSVFSKYIVFSKATQHVESDNYVCIGLSGDTAKKRITALFQPTASAIHHTTWLNENVAIQLDNDGLIYECWIRQSDIDELWPQLSEGLNLKGSRYWELLTIHHGTGDVVNDTIEMFIPQMLNYQITGAVSFTKGCYTGQEIVARMQYKGKLKRPMYRIKIASNLGEIAPGCDLYPAPAEVPADTTPSSIGNIVNIVNLADGSSEALAVVSSKHIEETGIVAGKPGYRVEILSLPYAITDSKI